MIFYRYSTLKSPPSQFGIYHSFLLFYRVPFLLYASISLSPSLTLSLSLSLLLSLSLSLPFYVSVNSYFQNKALPLFIPQEEWVVFNWVASRNMYVCTVVGLWVVHWALCTGVFPTCLFNQKDTGNEARWFLI